MSAASRREPARLAFDRHGDVVELAFAAGADAIDLRSAEQRALRFLASSPPARAGESHAR